MLNRYIHVLIRTCKIHLLLIVGADKDHTLFLLQIISYWKANVSKTVFMRINMLSSGGGV